MSARWVIIGDVIASRSHPDRRSLAAALEGAFGQVAARVPTGEGPAITVGDEFQAAYPHRDDVLAATFWLHVALVGQARVRMGIGYGEITHDEGRFPFGQDGPAWWRAREALERVAASETARGRLRRLTAVEGADDPLVDRYLAVRDHLVAGLDPDDAIVLTGLADGDPQTVIAERLGVHPSSVSRRIADHGLRALLLGGMADR